MIGLLFLAAAGAADAPILLLADEVRPVSSPAFADGAALIEGGIITAIGPAADITAPEGARVYEGAVLTPGLIDAWTTAGLSGIYNDTSDQDHAERDDPVRPDLRALDGYNPHDALVAWIRGYGVTTVQAGPSPGQPVSGRTLITRTTPGPVDAVALDPDASVVLSLGDGPKWRFGDEGAASRMGAAATVRQALASAQEYGDARRLPAADRPPI